MSTKSRLHHTLSFHKLLSIPLDRLIRNIASCILCNVYVAYTSDICNIRFEPRIGRSLFQRRRFHLSIHPSIFQQLRSVVWRQTDYLGSGRWICSQNCYKCCVV